MQVTIYTRQLCSFCDKAKEVFKRHKIEYKEIDCSFSTERMTEMIQRSGRMSYPQIFVNGTHVGGYDDMIEKIERGDLVLLVAPESR